MDQETIRARIDARKRASTVADLASDEAIQLPEAARVTFWGELWKLCGTPPRKAPQGPAIEPMTDRQARTFGAVAMPFGAHKGKRIDEIPLEYLGQITEPSPFIGQIRRYLASRRIQAEQPDRPEEE